MKITSWNPSSNDYVTTINTEGRAVARPFIYVESNATGTTDITNSEIAYLKHLSYYGGNGSIVKGNNIHHIWFGGFYSVGVGDIVIENNNVHDNGIYGLDPHTGTHDMIIRNNIVHDNGAIDIICSLDCYNITIENNIV